MSFSGKIFTFKNSGERQTPLTQLQVHTAHLMFSKSDPVNSTLKPAKSHALGFRLTHLRSISHSHLRLKSHVFASTTVMFFKSIASVISHYYCTWNFTSYAE